MNHFFLGCSVLQGLLAGGSCTMGRGACAGCKQAVFSGTDVSPSRAGHDGSLQGLSFRVMLLL